VDDKQKFSADTCHTPATVAEILGVTSQSVRNMLKDGRLKAIKGSTPIRVIMQREVDRYKKTLESR
jgi:hypothetical protein